MSTLVLAERYEILEKIGDGGMAVVYKARDRQLNRFVAIKILKKEFIADQTFVTNFIREAKAAASLLHPNIVTIHDAGKDRDIYYIVMEYVEGRPLSDVISAEAPLDYKRCIRIAKQVASALSLAHRNNIIHRDVKPHNILMTTDGTAKITDFGIARAVSDGTIVNDTGVIMGSVHYFSPEQSRGQYVDEKSDIYSLGIVLYEMITGRVPFDADNPVTIAVMHMNESIIPPARLVKGVPPGLDQIVMKATAKYQHDRFGNIDEMYKALDNVNFITGVIDGPAAGFVQPTNIIDEEPGRGYSNAAIDDEPEDVEAPYDDYDDEDDRDYKRKGRVERDEDDDYDDYDDDDDEEYDRKGRRGGGLFGFGGKAAKDVAEKKADGGKDGKDGKDDSGPMGLDKKQKTILIVAAIAIAVVLSIPLSKVIIGFFNYEPVMVPDVVGVHVNEATEILKEEGFSVDIDTVPLPATQAWAPGATDDISDMTDEFFVDDAWDEPDFPTEPDYFVGEVMEQSPEGGDMVRPGSKVKLKVAGPPEDVPYQEPGADNDELGDPTQVPDLLGKTKSSAEYAIASAGFKMGTVNYENSALPVDTVIEQSPKAGEMAPGNSRVNITISMGPKDSSTEVPRLVGKKYSDAEQLASAGKFKLSITSVFNKDVPLDTIYEQDPEEGSVIKEGATVSITVSLGGVPIVVGMSESDAKRAIEAVGLKYAKGGERDVANDSDVGKVLEQSATTGVRPGDTISCIVGKKAAPATFTVTVNSGTGSGTYAVGDKVNIKANKAPAGKNFSGWTVNGASLANPNSESTSFTMPANNVTVTANYANIPVTKYPVQVNFGTGSGSYEAGATVSISTNAADYPGMTFAGWIVESGGAILASPGSESTTFTMPASAVVVTAKWE